MSITVSNQKPVALNPHFSMKINGDVDPVGALAQIITEPLFTPLGQSPVTITDGPDDITEDILTDALVQTIGASIDPAAESMIHEVLRQSLINYSFTGAAPVNEAFVTQAASKHKLPLPSPRVIYAAGSDVIPSAKSILAGQSEGDELLVSLSYLYHPETLGVWFLTESAYTDFRTWVDQQATALSSVMSGNVRSKFQQFATIGLKGLTESLLLRAQDGDEDEEYSFARILLNLLMQYDALQATQPTREMGLMPFLLSELVSPKSVVMVNVEKHARSMPNKVDTEWKLINISLNQKVKVISNNKLSKLTAMARNQAKIAGAAANAASNQGKPIGKAAKINFRKRPPSKVVIYNGIVKVLGKMKKVNQSQNIFKTITTTFTKPNRRGADDYNKPGKRTLINFLPDVHIYLDTSGSISEQNYQDAVIMLIKLAKKLNVNIYFNSFSHVMSSEVMLRTANRSVSQIWQEFRKIPKVNGGTDFSQIWNYVNISKRRSERFSLVITDFGYHAPSYRMKHPKNLYYAPVAVTDPEWHSVREYAKRFEASMRYIEPGIAAKFIGMVR